MQVETKRFSVGHLPGEAALPPGISKPRVLIRPMRIEDIPLVVEMHERVSADSLYMRYLHPYKPTLAEIQELARTPGEDGAVFVAVADGYSEKVVGIANYRINESDCSTAQTAFLIEDGFQNRGLGKALVAQLVEDARSKGVMVLEASIHPVNRRMLHLFETTGYPVQVALSYGVLEARISLSPVWVRSH